MKKRNPRQVKVKSKVYNYQVANRRRHPGSSHWIHGVIVLVLIAVAAGIIYVWLRNRELNAGYIVSTLRKEIAQVKEERIKIEADVCRLKEPGRIREEVKRRRLGLRPAQSGQIVHIAEPPALVLDDEVNAPEPPASRKLWDAIVLGER